jgi:signal transduction histidine kinase
MSVNRIVVSWVLLSFCIAMVLTIYQFRTIKTTMARNQLRMVFIGSFFGYSIPMAYAFFYHFLLSLDSKYPFIFYEFAQGITHIILIICFLIALFRYRIWDIELYIKKVLLYMGATLVITLTYLVLVFFVNRLTEGESDVIRFLALVVSVISFLVLRDRIQQLIDRLFQRETYDTATVVSDFEAKLTGIYRFDELKQKIGQRIDEIFHLNSFVFSLKTADLVYGPAFAFGRNDLLTGSEFKINQEFEEKLLKSKVFSPEELNQKPLILRETNEELVVPLVADGQPAGFFICGRKKSERIYSRQDIQLLSLLARRVVALLHTASLYQKDLDRQFMLERERARISQDMHDDVGASLTRISILSELAKSRSDLPAETSQWLGQISDTSRGVMEEMSQIIWALNPKNDTLEGLVSYLRRFTFEYLEPSPVTCIFELPEAIPDTALSVEVRRNVYLVVREALHNMVKHSGAMNVWISMNPDGNRFIIRVKDDGQGFDPVNLQFPGNGLNNMKKRMSDISGEFQLTSQVGEGTEIRLVVPVC